MATDGALAKIFQPEWNKGIIFYHPSEFAVIRLADRDNAGRWSAGTDNRIPPEFNVAAHVATANLLA